MIGLNEIFEPSSLTEWIEQLKKDLKGEAFSKLERNDQIEDIDYTTFAHQESRPIPDQAPGNFPFTRGLRTSDNNWNNGYYLRVTDESTSNKKALEILMKGAELLIIDVSSSYHTDWNTLLNRIELEFIQAQFVLTTIEQYHSLRNFLKGSIPATISINIDPIGKNYDKSLIDILLKDLGAGQFAAFFVDGASIQQSGATTWHELGFCLSTGHEYLCALMESGLTIDEAAACIHFSIGIGSNYFYEVAKIRALKKLWSSVVDQYQPVHNCSYNCRITAHTGFLNKSLADPYTNLLRQTTEVMSAATGGVEGIVIHPYDSCSEKGTSVLSERMALNISLILKEESYFNAVIDPLGGSYAIENLTELIAERSWSFFQALDIKGGINSEEARTYLKSSILEKATLRIEQIRSGRKVLIGVNKFTNPKPETNVFAELPTYLGLPKLILEQTLISAQ